MAAGATIARRVQIGAGAVAAVLACRAGMTARATIAGGIQVGACPTAAALLARRAADLATHWGVTSRSCWTTLVAETSAMSSITGALARCRCIGSKDLGTEVGTGTVASCCQAMAWEQETA
jgi:hypothetical protein